MVKLLACGAKGMGFDSRSRRYNFRDLLSPASKSRYGWEIAKATYISSKQPTNQLLVQCWLPSRPPLSNYMRPYPSVSLLSALYFSNPFLFTYTFVFHPHSVLHFAVLYNKFDRYIFTVFHLFPRNFANPWLLSLSLVSQFLSGYMCHPGVS